MKKFDFNIKSFLSIQPKTRKRLSVFNNMKNVASKSNIINEYKDVGFIPNEKSRHKKSYLTELLSDVTTQIGAPINDDVGMNTLKPELIGIFDFMRIIDSDNQKSLVSKFIDYTFLFRQYKEAQIQSIIESIKGEGESSEIKIAQAEFRKKLLDTSSELRTFFGQISENLDKANDVRTFLMGMKHDRSAIPAAYNDVMVALSINSSDLQEFSNSEIVSHVIKEAQRTFFTTSKMWDSNDSYVITTNSGIKKFKRFNDLQAQDLSPYHLFSQEPGRVAGYNIFSNESSDTENIIRELMSIIIIESGAATAIAKIAQRNEIIQDITNDEVVNLTAIANDAFPINSASEIIIRNVQYTDAETGASELVDIQPVEFVETFQQLADVGAQFIVTDNEQEQVIQAAGNRKVTYENAYLRIIRNLDNNLNDKMFQELKNSANRVIGGTVINTMQQEMILNFPKLTNGIASIIDTIFDFRSSSVVNKILREFATLRNGPNPLRIDINGIDGPTINQIIALGQGITNAVEDLDPAVSRSFVSHQFSRLLAPEYVIYFIENVAEIFLMAALSNFRLAKAIFGLCLARNSTTKEIVSKLKEQNKLINISERTEINDDSGTHIHYKLGDIMQPLYLHGSVYDDISSNQLSQLNFARVFTKQITSMFAEAIDQGSEQFNNIVAAISQGNQTPNINQDIKINVELGNSNERITFQYTEIMKQVLRLLTQENGLIDKINNEINKFFPQAYLLSDSSKTFTTKSTAYSKIDYNIILMVYFELFRKTLTNGIPFSLEDSSGNEFKIKVDLQNEKISEVLFGDYVNRADYQAIIEPLREQHKAFDKYKEFRRTINIALIAPLYSQSNPVSRLEERINELRNKFEINISDIFNRGAIDQIETIAALLKQYDDLNSAGINNLETFIAKNEKMLAISQLKSNSFVKNIAMVPNPEDLNGPPIVLPDTPSRKIIAIGIPMGFKSEINKLLLQNEDFYSLNDPRYSNVLIDIYSRNIVERNDFSILKTARFDIDLFVDRKQFVVSQLDDFSLNNVKLFDRNDLDNSFPVNSTGTPDAAKITERRLNEVQSHSLKTYIKLLFGINLDESQFFVDRALLEIDPADSENESFNKMFDALVNNEVDKQMQLKTRNTNRLTSNIQSLITREGSRLKQFSNNLLEISKRELINETLSDSDKKIKLELEDAAMQIASVFQFSEDLSGGSGFFKRLVSPKLFEKIILIDIPCDINCLSDFYVKIRIEK